MRISAVLLGLLCALVSTAQGQMVQDMVDALVRLSPPSLERAGKTLAYEFSSEEIDAPFTGIALQGLASGDTLSGQVRFGSSQAWVPLYIVRSATDAAFLAAYRGTVLHTRQVFTLRFSIGQADSLSILAAGVFSALHEEEPGQTGHSIRGRGSAIIAPALITRRDWDAAPFIGTPQPLNRPSYVDMTLHHTAGFSAVTRTEGIEQVKRIQDFHQNGRGWRDIGYQFLMDQEGRLYQGRPFLSAIAFENGPPLALGAHVGGHNTGNIGVSLMGCYHPPEGIGCQDVMAQASLDSLLAVFAFFSERYGPGPDAISGHRDFGNTSCPGDNNYERLHDIRVAVEDLLRTGNAALGAAALAARTDSIGVVTIKWAFTSDKGILGYRIDRTIGTRSETLVRGTGAEDGRVIDTGVTISGRITYTLSARGLREREQILASVELEVGAPDDFVLAHNFPNPASGTTTIRYHLAQPGLVSLNIFDVTGRRVATLDGAYREEGRWYTAAFDAGWLAGGVYFYRLVLESFAGVVYESVQQMVIAR